MTDTNHPAIAGEGTHAESHHEGADVNVRGIFAFCVGLFVLGLVVHGIVLLLFQYFSVREAVRVPSVYPLAAGQETRLPPEPRLQTNPRADLETLRAQEEEVLRTYGWVDKTAGVVRIPIDEAMKLTLSRGLPARTGSGDARK